MSANWLPVVELIIVSIVVFGFGWHQLRDLKKYREKDKE